ncbi:MAG TPA: superoxide dismutase family protein [Devosia sp.]|jgi:Cu-Zn family superoxide dismutase|nr:superoxide dismutase family protein [Devosia sp.]
MHTKLLLTSALALALSLPAAAQDTAAETGAGAVGGDSALAVFTNVDGTEVGSVTLTPQEDGSVTVAGGIRGMSPGPHGFHFHQTGVCDASTDFESAGSHFNPTDKSHGLEDPDGPHLGDMPNVTAAEDGTVAVDVNTDLVSLNDEGDEGFLFDEDGTAIVIHAGEDDQMTDPSGNSGARVACAVVEPGAAVE